MICPSLFLIIITIVILVKNVISSTARLTRCSGASSGSEDKSPSGS